MRCLTSATEGQAVKGEFHIQHHVTLCCCSLKHHTWWKHLLYGFRFGPNKRDPVHLLWQRRSKQGKNLWARHNQTWNTQEQFGDSTLLSQRHFYKHGWNKDDRQHENTEHMKKKISFNVFFFKLVASKFLIRFMSDMLPQRCVRCPYTYR